MSVDAKGRPSPSQTLKKRPFLQLPIDIGESFMHTDVHLSHVIKDETLCYRYQFVFMRYAVFEHIPRMLGYKWQYIQPDLFVNCQARPCLEQTQSSLDFIMSMLPGYQSLESSTNQMPTIWQKDNSQGHGDMCFQLYLCTSRSDLI